MNTCDNRNVGYDYNFALLCIRVGRFRNTKLKYVHQAYTFRNSFTKPSRKNVVVIYRGYTHCSLQQTEPFCACPK